LVKSSQQTKSQPALNIIKEEPTATASIKQTITTLSQDDLKKLFIKATSMKLVAQYCGNNLSSIYLPPNSNQQR
jgi:hypothetical protein